MIEEIIRGAVKTNGAEAAFAVAMDVHTGEILAYVVEPGFNLNEYSSYGVETRRDLLSLYSYEPGSVFKIFSMASILDMEPSRRRRSSIATGRTAAPSPAGKKSS